MELDLDTGRLWIFLGGLFFFFIVESFLPARRSLDGRIKRLAFHAAIAALNTALVRVVVYAPFLFWAAYVADQGWGLGRWLGLHGWPEIIISVIVLDLFDYFWHRANHRIPFLWRFHKAHHTDNEMDVTTALRFHPGELIISGLVKAGWVLIWGPSVLAWFAFEAATSLGAQFHHSNIILPEPMERMASRVIVTPRYHLSHHLVDRSYGDANYAAILSFWDRLFGSYSQAPLSPGRQPTPSEIGLPEARSLSLSFRAWLSEPMLRRNTGLQAPDLGSG